MDLKKGMVLFVVGIVNLSVAEQAGLGRFRGGQPRAAANVKVEQQVLDLVLALVFLPVAIRFIGHPNVLFMG